MNIYEFLYALCAAWLAFWLNEKLGLFGALNRHQRAEIDELKKQYENQSIEIENLRGSLEKLYNHIGK